MSVSAEKGEERLKFVCKLLTDLCKRNDKAHELDGEDAPVSRFHGLKAPPMTLFEYLKRILEFSRCEPATLFIAMMYVDRITSAKSSPGCPTLVVNSLTVHRLLLTSIVLAIKYYDDFYFTNSYYGRIGGISNKELNQLEADFLYAIKFDLSVNPEDYQRYIDEVGDFDAITDYVNFLQKRSNAPTASKGSSAVAQPAGGAAAAGNGTAAANPSTASSSSAVAAASASSSTQAAAASSSSSQFYGTKAVAAAQSSHYTSYGTSSDMQTEMTPQMRGAKFPYYETSNGVQQRGGYTTSPQESHSPINAGGGAFVKHPTNNGINIDPVQSLLALSSSASSHGHVGYDAPVVANTAHTQSYLRPLGENTPLSTDSGVSSSSATSYLRPLVPQTQAQAQPAAPAHAHGTGHTQISPTQAVQSTTNRFKRLRVSPDRERLDTAPGSYTYGKTTTPITDALTTDRGTPPKIEGVAKMKGVSVATAAGTGGGAAVCKSAEKAARKRMNRRFASAPYSSSSNSSTSPSVDNHYSPYSTKSEEIERSVSRTSHASSASHPAALTRGTSMQSVMMNAGSSLSDNPRPSGMPRSRSCGFDVEEWRAKFSRNGTASVNIIGEPVKKPVFLDATSEHEQHEEGECISKPPQDRSRVTAGPPYSPAGAGLFSHSGTTGLRGAGPAASSVSQRRSGGGFTGKRSASAAVLSTPERVAQSQQSAAAAAPWGMNAPGSVLPGARGGATGVMPLPLSAVGGIGAPSLPSTAENETTTFGAHSGGAFGAMRSHPSSQAHSRQPSFTDSPASIDRLAAGEGDTHLSSAMSTFAMLSEVKFGSTTSHTQSTNGVNSGVDSAPIGYPPARSFMPGATEAMDTHFTPSHRAIRNAPYQRAPLGQAATTFGATSATPPPPPPPPLGFPSHQTTGAAATGPYMAHDGRYAAEAARAHSLISMYQHQPAQPVAQPSFVPGAPYYAASDSKPPPPPPPPMMGGGLGMVPPHPLAPMHQHTAWHQPPPPLQPLGAPPVMPYGVAAHADSYPPSESSVSSGGSWAAASAGIGRGGVAAAASSSSSQFSLFSGFGAPMQSTMNPYQSSDSYLGLPMSTNPLACD